MANITKASREVSRVVTIVTVVRINNCRMPSKSRSPFFALRRWFPLSRLWTQPFRLLDMLRRRLMRSVNTSLFAGVCQTALVVVLQLKVFIARWPVTICNEFGCNRGLSRGCTPFNNPKSIACVSLLWYIFVKLVNSTEGPGDSELGD